MNMEEEPRILQEFIHHDGILFKIYVIGDTWHVCIRPSLIIPKSIDVNGKVDDFLANFKNVFSKKE